MASITFSEKEILRLWKLRPGKVINIRGVKIRASNSQASGCMCHKCALFHQCKVGELAAPLLCFTCMAHKRPDKKSVYFVEG